MRKLIVFLVLSVFPISAIIFHIWTTLIAFSKGGFFAGILSFIFPVISEIYWMFKVWGDNELYTTVAVIHIVGTILYGLLGSRTAN